MVSRLHISEPGLSPLASLLITPFLPPSVDASQYALLITSCDLLFLSYSHSRRSTSQHSQRRPRPSRFDILHCDQPREARYRESLSRHTAGAGRVFERAGKLLFASILRESVATSTQNSLTLGFLQGRIQFTDDHVTDYADLERQLISQPGVAEFQASADTGPMVFVDPKNGRLVVAKLVTNLAPDLVSAEIYPLQKFDLPTDF